MAETVLKDMYHIYNKSRGTANVHPSNNSDGDVEEDLSIVKPNIMSYNGVLNAWSNADGGEGPDQCERILDALSRETKFDGNPYLPIMPGVEPNVSTFNTVIKAWARSGLPESGERAEALLDYMNEQVEDYDEEGRGYIHNSEDYYDDEDDANIVRPNVITYNSVMNAWSRSGSPNAAEKAESILKRLLSHPMGKGGELRPNGI
eukprot:13488565-Ditylum_brightwellii.AAC.1